MLHFQLRLYGMKNTEHGLSIDADVAIWIDSRYSRSLHCKNGWICFLELHHEFDTFKKNHKSRSTLYFRLVHS